MEINYATAEKSVDWLRAHVGRALGEFDLEEANFHFEVIQSELLALREAARWKPITPESLPKVEDDHGTPVD